jgi:hypothetical protein
MRFIACVACASHVRKGVGLRRLSVPSSFALPDMAVHEHDSFNLLCNFCIAVTFQLLAWRILTAASSEVRSVAVTREDARKLLIML